MSLSVTRSNGSTNVTFDLISQIGNQKNFGNSAAGLVEPEQITMQAFLRPPGAKGTDRYVLKAQKSFVEDTTGNYITCGASLTLTFPRSTESGLATAFKDQVAFIKSLLRSANLDLMMAGALPDGTNTVATFNPA